MTFLFNKCSWIGCIEFDPGLILVKMLFRSLPMVYPHTWKKNIFGISFSPICLKAGFHERQGRSRSRSRKSTSNRVKLKIVVVSGVISSTESELGIGFGRIRTVSFSSDLAFDTNAYDQWKLDCWSWRQKQKIKPAWFQLDRVTLHCSITTSTSTPW